MQHRTVSTIFTGVPASSVLGASNVGDSGEQVNTYLIGPHSHEDAQIGRFSEGGLCIDRAPTRGSNPACVSRTGAVPSAESPHDRLFHFGRELLILTLSEAGWRGVEQRIQVEAKR